MNNIIKKLKIPNDLCKFQAPKNKSQKAPNHKFKVLNFLHFRFDIFWKLELVVWNFPQRWLSFNDLLIVIIACRFESSILIRSSVSKIGDDVKALQSGASPRYPSE